MGIAGFHRCASQILIRSCTGISFSHASEARGQKVEPDLRAGFATLWFDRGQMRVRDNAHLQFCAMLSVVDIPQSKPAFSNFRTAPSAYKVKL
jgi:hypothetical protein